MSEAKTRRTPKKRVKQASPEDESLESCLICADSIHFSATGPCNHSTCHKCTFRQRALYNKRQCLICRTESEDVVFSEGATEAAYDDLCKNVVDSKNTYGVSFTTATVEEAVLGLLRNDCPRCSAKFTSFRDLTNHTKNDHNQFYCTICAKQKTSFVCELNLYTYKQLTRHQREGDAEGFKGHPECKFCSGKRFYSEDELNVHIRNNHERCFICDQYAPKTADYFRDYDHLYAHFKHSHYVCFVPSCVEKRFVVFRDDLDLTSHMLKEHGGVGTDSKVVIGSSRYYSQLSTNFTSRYLESNNDQEDHDSYEVKRRRFEERAKHYLSYNDSQFQRFVSLNSQYRSKRITARELLAQYRDLFTNQSDNEVYLLLVEFVELFPASNDLHKNLKRVVDELENAHNTAKFPVLGSPSHLSPQNTSGLWVNNKPGSKVGSNPTNEAFPKLSRPSKQPAPVASQQPVRYTTVVKKTVAKPVKRTQTNALPNYLTQPNVPTTSSQELSDRKFPALEKKSTKKAIPRVKEFDLPDPSKWGQQPQPVAHTENDFPVLQKKGKKKKQIIFG